MMQLKRLEDERTHLTSLETTREKVPSFRVENRNSPYRTFIDEKGLKYR